MKNFLFAFSSILLLPLAFGQSPISPKLKGFARIQGALQNVTKCPLTAGIAPEINKFSILEILGSSESRAYRHLNSYIPGVKVRVISNPVSTSSYRGGLAEEGCEGILPTNSVVVVNDKTSPPDRYIVSVSDELMMRPTKCNASFVHLELADVEILSLPIQTSFASLFEIKVRVLENHSDDRRFHGIGCEGMISANEILIRNAYTSGGRALVLNPQGIRRSELCSSSESGDPVVGKDSEVILLNEPEGTGQLADKITRIRVLSNSDSSEARAHEGCEGYIKSTELKVIKSIF